MTAACTVIGVSKAFGAVKALDDVSVDFFPGEIHAVLGENGAGKSTLMNVLNGSFSADSGSVNFSNPQARIGMVHQHFMLVPEFTVEENLLLASRSSALRLRPIDETQPVLELARRLGWELDPGAMTRDLPVGVQQRVEILKALAGGADILIFDEPTAVLSPEEVDNLFSVLRSLREEGKTLILIAHKLSEVLAIADRATVLRRGRFVGSALRADLTADKLAEWMVGDLPEALDREKQDRFEPALSVKELSAKGDRGEVAVNGVSFEIGAGEILGIGGVDGNGQVELAECLAGVRPFTGAVSFQGRSEIESAYIPQDRRRDGLAPRMSIFDNFMISGARRKDFGKGPLLDLGAARVWAAGRVETFRIKIGSLDDPARTLSGGNQQKIVVSRTLDSDPDLIVAVNPSRGLDIQATRDVHQTLLDAAARGAAIALISTDLDELAALADRTLFISRGRLLESQNAVSLVGGSE